MTEACVDRDAGACAAFAVTLANPASETIARHSETAIAADLPLMPTRSPRGSPCPRRTDWDRDRPRRASEKRAYSSPGDPCRPSCAAPALPGPAGLAAAARRPTARPRHDIVTLTPLSLRCRTQITMVSVRSWARRYCRYDGSVHKTDPLACSQAVDRTARKYSNVPRTAASSHDRQHTELPEDCRTPSGVASSGRRGQDVVAPADFRHAAEDLDHPGTGQELALGPWDAGLAGAAVPLSELNSWSITGWTRLASCCWPRGVG